MIAMVVTASVVIGGLYFPYGFATSLKFTKRNFENGVLFGSLLINSLM